MTISEWEFFHVLEGHLIDALHALVSGTVQSYCPRQIVKYVGKNYDKIFPLEAQSGLSFTSSAFLSINQVLNAKHHQQERQWAIVDEAVAQSLRILKDLEKKFNIQTTASVRELELLWPLVDKSDLAFAHKNNLLLAKVTDILPFPDMGAAEVPQNIQVALSVPEGLVSDDILEYLREVQDIPLMEVDVSLPGSITFKVAAQADVAAIIPEFMYSRKKITARIVQKIALTLHPLAETKTADHVRMALKSMDITTVRIHEPDRAKKTIQVEVESQEDANFIKEHGVNMKPQNLRVLENSNRPYVAYLDVPVKSPELFKNVWDNHYDFLPETIHFSDDLRSAAFILDGDQIARIGKAPPFVINWQKVLLVPYSPFRVKITFSSPMDIDRVQTALENLKLPGSFSVHVPYGNSVSDNSNNGNDFLLAYVHATDAPTKTALLANEIRVAPFKPSAPTLPTSASILPTPPPILPDLHPSLPTPPTPYTTSATQPTATPAKIEGENAPKTKNFVVSVSQDEMEGNSTAQGVRQALLNASSKHECGKWSISFVFEREGKFYADVFCEKPNLAAQITSVLIGAKQVAIDFVDTAPYYLLKLENVPHVLDTTKLFNYFKKEAKIFIGQIKLKYGDAIVPCARSDLHAFLAKKVIKINNVVITVSDASAPVQKNTPSTSVSHEKPPLVERKTTIKFIVAQFLKRKKKEDLDNIASEFSVKIQVTSLKQTDNNVYKDKKGGNPKYKPANPSKAPVQNFLLVRGNHVTNVAQAIERVTFLINENEIKQVNLKYSNEKLFTLAYTKILGCLREFNSHEVVYFIKKVSETELAVHICGDPSGVDEAEQSVNTVRELTCGEVDIPPTLVLEFSSLETKYDVKTEFDKSNAKLSIFGSKESVAELTEHIQSKINNIKTTAHVKFLKEPFLFAQKYFFYTQKWIAKVKEMEVEVKFNEASWSVTIKGKQANIKTAKEEIQKMKSTIGEKKIQMTINKHILPLLQEHVTAELGEGVFCNVRDLASSPQDAPQEDEDDMDDTSSISSDLSVGTSTSLKSSSSNLSMVSQVANTKANSSNITVEVGAWYFFDLEGRVTQVFDGLKKGTEVQKIKYTQDDIPAIQKNYNFAYVQKRNRVSVFNHFLTKTLLVRGFSSERVKQACEFITNTIQNNANKVAHIPVNKHLFFFLKQKRELFLAQLKQQLNLKRIQLVYNKADPNWVPPANTTHSQNKNKNKNANPPASGYDKNKGKNNNKVFITKQNDRFFVEAEGHPTKIERLEQELANVFIRYEKVPVQFGTAASLKEFEEDLKATYDVATFVTDFHPGFEFLVTGERNLPHWKEIMDKLESLKGVSEDYKPSDYTRLAEIVLSKKELDLQAFKNEYNLFKKPFFNHEKSTVFFVAQKKEDIVAASTALEGILNNKRIETAVVVLPKRDLAPFFTTGGPYANKIEEIVKKYKLAYQWRIPRSIVIRGPKDVLNNTKEELETEIQRIVKNFAKKPLQLSTSIVAELKKENNSMCKDCFIQSGVLITFPETDALSDTPANIVLYEINLPDCKIQVVQGDITKEPTKCIVNAANSNLSHAGGIAHDISQKAGDEFNQLCAKLIAVRGPVAPGTCVITAAGNIPPPINHVIHAVGPQWRGGLYNESQTLAYAIKSTLALADEFKIPSISIPTISAGIFGYPLQECAQVLAQTVFRFAAYQTPTAHVKQIRLCEKDATVAKILVENLMNVKEGKITKKPDENMGLVYQWSWMEDMQAKTWKPFDPNENFQIEIAYLSQGRKGKMTTTITGDVNQVKNGFTYEIDFDAMTELNTKFRATHRPIKREPLKQTANFSWEIQNQKGEWAKFGQLENQQVSLNLRFSVIVYSYALFALYDFVLFFRFFSVLFAFATCFFLVLRIGNLKSLVFFKRKFPVMLARIPNCS
eukprot:Phypoly_transcript_00080.p1 GENE.Phypoly_transcript_00080~~Phypoly_transcript_00080.p1  ORF type:complete len:1906 (+),score=336.70 Phypoly_transcript_00080:404-6121(+)